MIGIRELVGHYGVKSGVAAALKGLGPGGADGTPSGMGSLSSSQNTPMALTASAKAENLIGFRT